VQTTTGGGGGGNGGGGQGKPGGTCQPLEQSSIGGGVGSQPDTMMSEARRSSNFRIRLSWSRGEQRAGRKKRDRRLAMCGKTGSGRIRISPENGLNINRKTESSSRWCVRAVATTTSPPGVPDAPELQLAFACPQGRFEHRYCKFDIFGGLAQNGCCFGVRRTVGELAAMYGARSQSLNLDLIHIAFPRSLPGTGAQMARRTGPKCSFRIRPLSSACMLR